MRTCFIVLCFCLCVLFKLSKLVCVRVSARARVRARECVCVLIAFEREVLPWILRIRGARSLAGSGFSSLRGHHFNRNRITLARVFKQAVSSTRKRLGDTTCLRTTLLSMRVEGEQRRIVGVTTMMLVTPRKQGSGPRGRRLRNLMATEMGMISRTGTKILHGLAFRYRASPKRRGSVRGGWGKFSLPRFRYRIPCSAVRQRGRVL